MIAWAPSDLNKFTPASAPLFLSRETRASSSSNQGSSSGLSTGAKAGIGAGVAAAVIALIALFVFLLIFRRKHRRREAAETERRRISSEYQQYHYEPKSPPGYQSPDRPGFVAYGKVASGLESPGVVSELSSNHRRSELGSSRRMSELDDSKAVSNEVSPELEGNQVFEAHGTPIPQQQHAISHGELSDLGLSPIAARRGVRSNVNRGPSSPSAPSAYSTYDASEGSYTVSPQIPGSNLAGRWEDNPEYGYGTGV